MYNVWDQKYPIRDWSMYRPEEFMYRGKWIYNWFSNMDPVIIYDNGIQYNSSENYYQAHKTWNIELHTKIASMTPQKAKQFCSKPENIKLDSNWESVKIDIMRMALIKKWSLPVWKNLLLNRKERPIIEWNNWNDTFWGVSEKTNKGRNILGLLMADINDTITQNKFLQS